ncbi:MAG TPA: apolipoprotein N-acyltransferase, partial [Kofleriaceae bacterium]|nr:apolipoprotein N-acyltransferase [Kofleriaceae bacterium]
MSTRKKKPARKKKDPRRPRPKEAPSVAGEVAPTDTPAPRRDLGMVAPLVARFPSQWFLFGLAVLSGVLWFLACADWDIWPLAWIAMVPGLIAVEAAPTTRRALLYGWVTGIVGNIGGFYWITGLLTRFGHLPMALAILGLLLLAAYQASVFLFFALVIRKLRDRTARRGRIWPVALLAPLVMVGFEMLVPFLFPFYLAITQAWVTPVIQIADLTGPVGVTALLLTVNGGVYDFLVAARGTGARRALPLAAAAGVLVGALVYGFVRMHQVDAARAEAPAIQVGIVQGNIPFDEKGYKRPDLAPRQLRDLQRVSADLEEQGADLIVWSESSYPFAVPREQETDFPEASRIRVRRGFTRPLVFGAITTPADEDALNYNSALYLLPDDRFAGRFDKIFLLMFGEYIPFRDVLEPILPKNASHFARGEGVTTFPFSHEGVDYRLGPMICYEDILPGFGRKLAALHPHLLVNITNDAWFGDTAEPWEHLALSVFRSVETGRPRPRRRCPARSSDRRRRSRRPRSARGATRLRPSLRTRPPP